MESFLFNSIGQVINTTIPAVDKATKKQQEQCQALFLRMHGLLQARSVQEVMTLLGKF